MYGEVPQNAGVTAEQAESALGRTLATELDLDLMDAVDADTKEKGGGTRRASSKSSWRELRLRILAALHARLCQR